MVTFPYRRRIEIKSDKIEVGPPRLTVYELARIIGARAAQIAHGAPILISLLENHNVKINEIEIARRELKAKVLPITVQRWLPDGRYQNIPIQWLKYLENI